MELDGGALRKPAPAEELDAFATYLRHTDEKAVAVEALLSRVALRRPELAARLLDPRCEVSILFAGAGRGDLEIPLLQRIIAARGTSDGVTVHCVDADPKMRDAFLQAADTAGIGPCVAGYAVEKLETYRAPEGTAFDLAVSAHVLYYVENWSPVIAGLQAAVADRGGAAALVLLSRESDNVTLRSALMARRGGARFHGTGEDVDA